MKIVTYLGFTLLSILIQFCVMDFIQEISGNSKKLNSTTQKKKFGDVLKHFNDRPAIYYQNRKERLYSNTTLPDLLFDNTTTTETTSAVFDILYDDNISTTEEAYTTETFYTTVEYENVTELTFFGKNNQTTSNPQPKPSKSSDKCNCDFLYKVCDIHCCCDDDCTDTELKLFPNCNVKITNIHPDETCQLYLTYFGYRTESNMFDNLFCVVKTNLPKRDLDEDKVESMNNFYYTWKTDNHRKTEWEFANKQYSYGDPVWLIKNETIYYMDFPSQTVNSYCSGRKSILFLKDEKYNCKVKFADLEMFQFLRNLNETYVISATPLSMNTSVLNCSNLHCVNWTIQVCDNVECTNFNKTKHEPACTDLMCTNLALDLDYTFYYHDTRITNATITFYVQNVSVNMLYMMQSINVRFIMSNQSIDTIMKLSGNPGYMERLPIIISYASSNYTESFFNKTKPRYFLLPKNEKGTCVMSNITNNFINFGINKRISCKFVQKYMSLQNRTKECRIIQDNIVRFMKLQNNVSISSLGNPQGLKDNDWLQLQCLYSTNEMIYGRFNMKLSVLECYNIITRFSLVFSIANNKIIAAKCDYAMKNLSLSIDDIVSINLSVDISFIDITKPSVFQEDSPHLNLHIPEDFFYPYRSSESHRTYFCQLLMLLLSLHYFLQIK